MNDAADADPCGCSASGHVDTLMSVEGAVRFAASLAVPVRDTDLVSLRDAAGRVLARELHAPRPMPFFDNSAMDGFAVRCAELRGDGPWELPVLDTAASAKSASASAVV